MCVYAFIEIILLTYHVLGLVWLREQILHGGGPDWLERDGAQPQGVEPDANNGNNNLPVENVVEQAGDNQNNNDNQPQNIAEGQVNGEGDENAGDDNNWIPMEWDRPDELTWERLLGLDGSIAFLEHVFWVVSLNTLFILVFAFCPYHMGLTALSFLGKFSLTFMKYTCYEE